MEPYDFKALIEALKQILKAKKINYRTLAERVGMSESGIKKLFIAQDCSINKLNQLCTAAGISLSDLLHASTDENAKRIPLPDPVQSYFVKQFTSFQVFWKLAAEHASVEKIRIELSLTPAQMVTCLKNLEKFGLIERQSEMDVKVVGPQSLLWEDSGPLVQRIKKEWAHSTLKQALQTQPEKLQSRLGLRYLRLRPESLKDLFDALSDLENEFEKRSSRDDRLYPEQVLPVKVLLAAAQGNF